VADGGAPAGDGGAEDATAPPDGGVGPIDDDAAIPRGACGYEDSGVPLHVAAGLDLCLPRVACTAETCPPGAGQCAGAGGCVFSPGYQGVATLPEAWVTYYCDLTTGGCHGVGQVDYPEVTAQKIATAMGLPTCTQGGGAAKCVGIAAAPPMMIGNSQLAKDSATGQQVKAWGLGLTEASGLCYELEGPGGTAVVALTDRCGGYCTCGGSAPMECGACVNAPDMRPDCPCVGTVPGLYTSCCGATCGVTQPSCDWCAANNHPHFDLDQATFDMLCAAEATRGSCRLSGVRFFPCMAPTPWPPP
jgi:hypothetical protein